VAAGVFEMNYGLGLIELFRSDTGSYSLLTFVTNVVTQIDGFMYGTLVGVACLLLIWLIYQKTDSVVSIYFVAVLGLYLMSQTMFAEMTTVMFYIICLAVTAVLYVLLRGKQ